MLLYRSCGLTWLPPALSEATWRRPADLAEARRLSLDDSYSSIARLRAAGLPRAPKVRELIEAIYFDGLRKAGMPEE